MAQIYRQVIPNVTVETEISPSNDDFLLVCDLKKSKWFEMFKESNIIYNAFLFDSPQAMLILRKNKEILRKMKVTQIVECLPQVNLDVDKAAKTCVYVLKRKYSYKLTRKRLFFRSGNLKYVPYTYDYEFDIAPDVIIQRNCDISADHVEYIVKQSILSNIQIVSNFFIYSLLKTRFYQSTVLSEVMTVPKFLLATPINAFDLASSLKFPIIVKNDEASDHFMYLVADLEGLRKCLENVTFNGIFLQEFISCGGYMVKAYKLGDTIELTIRPSLASWGDLMEIEELKEGWCKFSNEIIYKKTIEAFFPKETVYRHNEEELEKLTAAIAKKLNCELVGVDFLVDEKGQVSVLEVNYFPSYRGIKGNKDELLEKHLLRVIEDN